MHEKPMLFMRPEIVESLQRYAQGHIEPGSFLRACLENNLKEAMAQADTYNSVAIFPIVNFIYNFIPNEAQGSPEKVQAWLSQRQ